MSALSLVGVGLGIAAARDDRPAGVASIPGCKAPADAYKPDSILDDIASDDMVDEGWKRAEAKRWLQSQARAHYLIDAIRASPARHDFMNFAFDNDRRELEVAVRHHGHDDAIRDCAQQLKLFPVRFVQVKHSEWELSQGQRRFEDAIPDDYFDIYETYQDDIRHFTIEVYRDATPAQRDRIRQAAKASGVEFEIKETDTAKPQASFG